MIQTRRAWKYCGRAALAMLLAAALPQIAPAPIYGDYVDLDRHIGHSDSVVVAEITAMYDDLVKRAGAKPQDLFIRCYDHEFLIRRVIMDRPHPNHKKLKYGDYLIAGMRQLALIRTPPQNPDKPNEFTYGAPPAPFIDNWTTGTLLVLFLQREPIMSPYVPISEDLRATAWGINYEGNHIPLAPDTNLFHDVTVSVNADDDDTTFTMTPSQIISFIVKDSTSRFADPPFREQAKEWERKLFGQPETKPAPD